jgi:hypothetical protein
MEQLQIEATAAVLTGLHDVEDLYLVRSTVEQVGEDLYRVSGYAPESIISELEARGCVVQVLMSSQAIEEFHNEIVATVAPPPETPTAETQTPETPPPDTETPETPPPETQTPETPPPETETPGTPAPETEPGSRES